MRSAALLLTLVLSGAALGASEQPYLYQRSAFGADGLERVEIDGAFGSRDAALFGEAGYEQGMRLCYGVGSRLTVELWGGSLLHAGERERVAGAVELLAGVLDEPEAPIRLSLGVGVARDFRDATVVRLRGIATRGLGSSELSLNGLAEIPLGADRDRVDLMVGGAYMTSLRPGLRLGAELLTRDIEGLWDPNEAEGGARLAFGPSGWLALGDQVGVKANVGAVLPLTQNPYRRDGTLVESTGAAFLVRMAMLYSF